MTRAVEGRELHHSQMADMADGETCHQCHRHHPNASLTHFPHQLDQLWRQLKCWNHSLPCHFQVSFMCLALFLVIQFIEEVDSVVSRISCDAFATGASYHFECQTYFWSISVNCLQRLCSICSFTRYIIFNDKTIFFSVILQINIGKICVERQYLIYRHVAIDATQWTCYRQWTIYKVNNTYHPVSYPVIID